MSRISGLRNDMNKTTFYKERKINNRCFNFLSKQNIIVPLIMDMCLYHAYSLAKPYPEYAYKRYACVKKTCNAIIEKPLSN